MIVTYNHLVEQLDFLKYFVQRPVTMLDKHVFDYMLTGKNHFNSLEFIQTNRIYTEDSYFSIGFGTNSEYYDFGH